jgi:hypothetical protein
MLPTLCGCGRYVVLDGYDAAQQNVFATSAFRLQTGNMYTAGLTAARDPLQTFANGRYITGREMMVGWNRTSVVSETGERARLSRTSCIDAV